MIHDWFIGWNIHRPEIWPLGIVTPVPDNNLQRHRSEVVVITVLQIYFVKIGKSPKIMILYIIKYIYILIIFSKYLLWGSGYTSKSMSSSTNCISRCISIASFYSYIRTHTHYLKKVQSIAISYSSPFPGSSNPQKTLET